MNKTTRLASSSVFILALLACIAAPSAATTCKRAELEWPAWRDNVLASNPQTDFFELRADGRDELLKALGCGAGSEDCKPDALMVFHCTNNMQVLIAFVTAGCVTRAKEISVKDYMSYVTGGAPC